jgi:predicted nuclease of predicted toxin-antitoxin system
MLRLLIDQDLDHVIVRGLLLRVPNVDVLTAHQVGLSNASDSEVLAWAAEQERILITHDRRTMPYHAASRIARAEKLAGIIIVSRQLPISQVINELEIIVSCSDMIEWENIIKHLPL